MSYIEDLFSLKGKIAVITGGGGVLPGIIAESLFNAGAKVSLWGWRKESIERKKKELIDKYERENDIHIFVVDTGNENRVKEALATTIEEFGIPEILVNGVGGNRGKSLFTDVEIKLFEDILRLNLLAGLVVPSKVFIKYWVENNVKASVINIASMTSYVPLSGVWAYDAAKAGVLNLTMGLAREYAPFGIRVNAIAPGFFIGKQNRSLLIDDVTGKLTDRGKAIIERTPFGRFGEPKELSAVAVFLASNSASGFVTGVSIPVDGGYLVNNI